jgi:hypothetical protein
MDVARQTTAATRKKTDFTASADEGGREQIRVKFEATCSK